MLAEGFGIPLPPVILHRPAFFFGSNVSVFANLVHGQQSQPFNDDCEGLRGRTVNHCRNPGHRMHEFDAHGREHQMRHSCVVLIPPIQFRVAMLNVTNNGVSNSNHVPPNLMKPASLWLSLNQRAAGCRMRSGFERNFKSFQRSIGRLRFLRWRQEPFCRLTVDL